MGSTEILSKGGTGRWKVVDGDLRANNVLAQGGRGGDSGVGYLGLGGR